MKVTFVDAAELIAAAQGGSEQAARAMGILDDPEREFSSQRGGLGPPQALVSESAGQSSRENPTAPWALRVGKLRLGIKDRNRVDLS